VHFIWPDTNTAYAASTVFVLGIQMMWHFSHFDDVSFLYSKARNEKAHLAGGYRWSHLLFWFVVLFVLTGASVAAVPIG
jgi:hypothetical protein